MDKSLEKAFQVIEDIQNVRYKVEKNIINQLNEQSTGIGQGSSNQMFKESISLLNMALEGRHSIEKNVISGIKNSLNTQSTKEESGREGADLKHGKRASAVTNLGTILIKAAKSQKSIDVPINLNNKILVNQVIKLEMPPLRNMETGEEIPGKISLDQDEITLEPQSTGKVKVNFDLKKDFKTKSKYFTSLLIRGVEQNMFQIIVEFIPANTKNAKSSVTYLPAKPT
ncbi:MAG TPA: hypothetical protein VJ917_06615 [Saprospiraceae bacterium]|nr:hypothetical protein [Saprospiraceae bacterium]